MNSQTQISSFAPLGLGILEVSPALDYLHQMEVHLEQSGGFGVPSVAGPYGGPAAAGWLVCEGPPWITVEEQVITRLIDVIREIRPGQFSDSLSLERLKPFAFPVIYLERSGRRTPAYGAWMAQRERIFLLRRYLLYRWPLMLNVLYHEVVHSVEDRDPLNPRTEKVSELSAHGESLAFLDAALLWVRQLRGDPNLLQWIHTLFQQLRVAEVETLAGLSKL